MLRTNTARWMENRAMWRIDVQKDGMRRSFYSAKPGRTGQREANKKADEWLEGKTDGDLSKKRVSELYTMWLEEQCQTTSASNVHSIRTRWEPRILPAIGNLRISQVTENDLQKIINAAYADGLAKKSMQNIMANIRQFYKWCRRVKATQLNPEFLQIPAGARAKGAVILQPNDLRKLMTIDTTLYRGKVVPDKYVNAYRFAVLTGLRPGELIGLRWSDIWGVSVHIRRSVNVRGEVTQGKNENAVRSFAMTEQAAQVLEAQRAVSVSESVFDIPSEESLYKRWKVYCSANSITPCSLYQLRHTFVSVCKTLPAGEVKSLVGHSRSMDTFGVYSHTLEGVDTRTAAAVSATFDKLLAVAE